MSRFWLGNPTVEYLTFPANTVWAYNTNICLMTILRCSDITHPIAIVSVGDSNASRGFGLSMYTDGLLFQVGVGQSNVFGTSITTVLANQWLALMAHWSTGSNRLFKRYNYETSSLSSESITTTTATPAPNATDTENRIGNWMDASGPSAWVGDIDRVLISSGTAPSDSDFTAWAREGIIPPSLTVKGYWILSPSGTATAPEVDLSGNALHITGGNIVGTTGSAAFVLPGSDAFLINVAEIVGMGDKHFPVG